MVAPRGNCSAELTGHDTRVCQTATATMIVCTFWINLIIDVDRCGTSLFQLAPRARCVRGISKARTGVDDQWHIDGTADGGGRMARLGDNTTGV